MICGKHIVKQWRNRDMNVIMTIWWIVLIYWLIQHLITQILYHKYYFSPEWKWKIFDKLEKNKDKMEE